MSRIVSAKKHRLPPRHRFLLLVLGLYVLFAVFDPALTAAALSSFVAMGRKVIPILALVFVVMLLVNIFLDPARIRRHLGKDSGLRGWLYAIASGIVISGPPFVLYPMLGDLKRHGARNALLATMLYNRNVKIYFLPAIVYYFGLRYAVVLSGYIIVFSVLNGLLLEFFVRHD